MTSMDIAECLKFNSFKEFADNIDSVMHGIPIAIATAGPSNGYEEFTWDKEYKTLDNDHMTIRIYSDNEQMVSCRDYRFPGFYILKSDPRGQHIYAISDDGQRTWPASTMSYFGRHPSED